MADREKVIKGIECCLSIGNADACGPCPYKDECANAVGKSPSPLRRDAISLLKAQEPIEPIEMIDDFYPIGDPLRTVGWKCGKCGERIAGYDNYCPNCGHEVKWDE